MSRRSIALHLLFWLALLPFAAAEPVDPEIGRMLERALAEAENFRKELPRVEYEASMRVQEWDGRGRLRGTARATAVVRPGAKRSMIFTSREVQGKVRLPDDKEDSSEPEEKEVTLQEFARDHQIATRFAFVDQGSENIAGAPARRVSYSPKANQPEKNTADRFLDNISGEAWVSEDRNKLVKFEMHLLRPFQLFWIFAVLKDLSIQYELISPGEILGRARLKITFALNTPLHSIRQVHEVEINHFKRRDSIILAE